MMWYVRIQCVSMIMDKNTIVSFEFEFPKTAELHLLTHCSPVGALCLFIATPAKFLSDAGIPGVRSMGPSLSN